MADKNEWKKTLNLPQTAFPMKAGLPQTEPARLEKWASADLYREIQRQSEGRPRFVLHDGPPYANGRIHIGHALNKILKDFIVRSRSMMGYDAPYVPGWDCHGLPIEHQVDKELGSKKREMSAAEFRRACRAFAEKYVGIQAEDFRRLGVLGSWDQPYLTMSYDYEASIAESLGRFFETGAVYKGLKPVHWCTYCQTALAEAEVEYDEHRSPSVYVAFRARTEAAERFGLDPAVPLFAVIWTTTPWTLPANLAIALREDFDYSVVSHGGSAYVVATGLLGQLTSRFAWDEAPVLATFRGSDLDGLHYDHPFIEREGVFVTADYVTLEQGTGLVHTAPGHGADDFLTGRRYGLPTLTPVNHRGEFTSDVPDYAGLHVFKANPQIVEMLEQRGVLLANEEIAHSYPHCWRCKHPIIFRATEQWFISMEQTNLRAAAVEQIEKVRWIPSWGVERIRGMVENRPDWCISRQRLWGVPITVLYCEACNETIHTPEFFGRVVELFRAEGADAWFERPATDFLPSGACACGSTDLRKETDILDVWFDSGCSNQAVLKTREELAWPADVYMEGHDQHRGWFQSSLLVATGIDEKAPFRSVITHGFVVDERGRKMSKSVGNVVSPQDVIKQHGADILRMWVAMIDYRDDMAIGPQILTRLSEGYRKIRNTARYLLANLNDFDPAKDQVSWTELPDLDRWIVDRSADLAERCRRAYESYEFHTVYHRVVDFCTVDLSSFYLDVTKDRMYLEAAEARGRRAGQTAMYKALEALVGVIAPIMVFTAEEIYEFMPGRRESSVHLTAYPTTSPERLDDSTRAAWERVFAYREAATGVLEKKRAAGEIGSSLEADLVLSGLSSASILGGLDLDLAEIAIVSHADVVEDAGASAEAVEIPGAGTLRIGVKAARGRKCGRCWQFREEVETDLALCARCEQVVGVLTTE